MLTELCQYLRNWFDRDMPKITGTFEIVGGAIEFADGDLRLSDTLQSTQYYRIVGSIFNDGVHQYDVDALQDEKPFKGAIWAMSIPPTFIVLDNEITDWIAKNEGAINSPYQSESFGGYSYSKGYSGGTAQGVTWQGQFAARLAPWRKI